MCTSPDRSPKSEQEGVTFDAHATSRGPRRCVSWWHVAFVLACISPATTEVFAPSMRYATDVDATSDEVSTAIFVGLAAAMHVIHGYVADGCGVVALSLGGLALHVTSSLIIGFGLGEHLDLGLEEGSDILFMSMRVVQGIGASACTVGSLACVRAHLDALVDVPTMYTARACILVVAPALSEFLCSTTRDWHAAFLLMGFGGTLSFVVVLLGSHSSSSRTAVLSSGGDGVIMVARRVCFWWCRREAHTLHWRRVRSLQPTDMEPVLLPGRAAAAAGDDDTLGCARSRSERAQERRTSSASTTPRSVPFKAWVVVDALGFGAMFVWIAYAPLLEDVEYFGYMYSLTFVGSVIGSAVAQHVRTTRHVGAFVIATSVQLCVAVMSYAAQQLAQTHVPRMRRNETQGVERLVWTMSTVTTFALMTVSNGARAVAASHATACAMKTSSTTLSPGRASGTLHSIRMAITCSMLVVALNTSPWLVIVHALAVALLIMHVVV